MEFFFCSSGNSVSAGYSETKICFPLIFPHGSRFIQAFRHRKLFSCICTPWISLYPGVQAQKAVFLHLYSMDFSLSGPFRHRKPISSICTPWISLYPGRLGTGSCFPAFVLHMSKQYMGNKYQKIHCCA